MADNAEYRSVLSDLNDAPTDPRTIFWGRRRRPRTFISSEFATGDVPPPPRPARWRRSSIDTTPTAHPSSTTGTRRTAAPRMRLHNLRGGVNRRDCEDVPATDSTRPESGRVHPVSDSANADVVTLSVCRTHALHRPPEGRRYPHRASSAPLPAPRSSSMARNRAEPRRWASCPAGRRTGAKVSPPISRGGFAPWDPRRWLPEPPPRRIRVSDSETGHLTGTKDKDGLQPHLVHRSVLEQRSVS